MEVKTVWKVVFFATWLIIHRRASACSFAPTVCQQEFPEVVEEPILVEPVPVEPVPVDPVPVEPVDENAAPVKVAVKREAGELESFPVRDLYGQGCVCLETSSNTYVCFNRSVEFDLPTEASFSEDQGTEKCPVLCARDASSDEVCEPVCEFTELQLTSAFAGVLKMSADGSWGENRICTKPYKDSCCPERGTFCKFHHLECVKPRCQNLSVEGCLQCQCATTRSFLSCPEPIDCTFHNAHICCIPPEVSGTKDYICDVWGKDTIVGNEWIVEEFYLEGSTKPIFPGETKLSEECPADGEKLNTCEEVINSDEDCCPVSCGPKVPPPVTCALIRCSAETVCIDFEDGGQCLPFDCSRPLPDEKDTSKSLVCGTIAGLLCPFGSFCQLDGPGADRAGICCPVVKPGDCPDIPPDSFGICVEECSTDVGASGCPGREKCCPNACGGHVCVDPVPVLPPVTCAVLLCEVGTVCIESKDGAQCLPVDCRRPLPDVICGTIAGLSCPSGSTCKLQGPDTQTDRAGICCPVAKPEPEPDCLAPKDSGPCKAFFPSYFFNAKTGKCDKFTYGGCGGNSNRFSTLEECQEACSPCEYGPPFITNRRYLRRCWGKGPGKGRFNRCPGKYFCNRKWGVCCPRRRAVKKGKVSDLFLGNKQPH